MKIRFESHEMSERERIAKHCTFPPGTIFVRAIGPENERGAMECWEYVTPSAWKYAGHRRRIKRNMRRQIDFAIRSEVFYCEIIREHDHPSHRCVWKAIENMTARMNGNNEPWKTASKRKGK